VGNIIPEPMVGIQTSHLETISIMASKIEIPPMASYPERAWRARIMPEEWSACIDAWVSLSEAHLSLSLSDLGRISAKDKSVATFLTSYVYQAALSHDTEALEYTDKWKVLRRDSFILTRRLLETGMPPEDLLSWGYLADFSKAYGRTKTSTLLATLWNPFPPKALELSLAKLKTYLIISLGTGLKGDPKSLEQTLKRLNHLLHSSPDTAVFFMSGTDFLDGLVSCYKLMNPPLRKAILSTTYLCLAGLTEGSHPNLSILSDQLYSLKAAAEAHKTGPVNENDSLVAELVTATPILRQTQHRIEAVGKSVGIVKSVIAELERFRKVGGSQPKRKIKRKIDKGKAKSSTDEFVLEHASASIHVHRMSLISQVQDLFPDLGSGFVMKLLDEYNDNVEDVISHLLENLLPPHLDKADRSESL
jgi:activating signal cointegrator complex subunit 2